MNDSDWQRWRGRIDMKLEAHQTKLEDHCERLDKLEEKVREVLVKLAVPLFLSSLLGVGLGGVLVFIFTKAIH